MIKDIYCSLSITGMEYAESMLQEETENPAIGVVVSLSQSKIIGEVLEASGINGLRLTVLRDAPETFWMLYNTQMCVIANID